MNPDANVATSSFTPDAQRHLVEHVIHGDRRMDVYGWLRHKNDPAVIAHLNAENTYTDAVLRDTESLQEKLYQEMLGRILQTDLSVPYRLRGYLYFTRTEEGKQYPVHCRKREAENGQVMYWEPAKYVTKLRTLNTDSNPLLLKINMGPGHGGASGRYDYLREIALDYAFLLSQLGIRD